MLVKLIEGEDSEDFPSPPMQLVMDQLDHVKVEWAQFRCAVEPTIYADVIDPVFAARRHPTGHGIFLTKSSRATRMPLPWHRRSVFPKIKCCLDPALWETASVHAACVGTAANHEREKVDSRVVEAATVITWIVNGSIQNITSLEAHRADVKRLCKDP